MIGSKYNRRTLQYRSMGGIVNPTLMTMPLQASNTFQTLATTNGYNAQCRGFLQEFNSIKENYQKVVEEKLLADFNYRGHRQAGVKLAWKYEQADIKMGGKGSADWNQSQRQEILENGSVRGAEGHHQKNVANHPKYQADPDNIKFYKTGKEHLNKGHGGNWQNESDAPMIDKDAMLKATNRKRVISNELKGAGIAAVIGFVTGASIGFIVTLAQNGLSPETFKQAAVTGGQAGAEGMAFGLINHVASRVIGETTMNAMTGLLSNVGIEITENITKACNMGVVGSIAIVTFSVYQFIKLRREGYNTGESFSRVGRQVMVSVSSLAVTVIVQATYGGAAALAVGIGISVVLLSYSMYQTQHNKLLMEKIQSYAIEKSYPLNFA